MNSRPLIWRSVLAILTIPATHAPLDKDQSGMSGEPSLVVDDDQLIKSLQFFRRARPKDIREFKTSSSSNACQTRFAYDINAVKLNLPPFLLL